MCAHFLVCLLLCTKFCSSNSYIKLLIWFCFFYNFTRLKLRLRNEICETRFSLSDFLFSLSDLQLRFIFLNFLPFLIYCTISTWDCWFNSIFTQTALVALVVIARRFHASFERNVSGTTFVEISSETTHLPGARERIKGASFFRVLEIRN